MSGGFFDYKQYLINEIADIIEKKLTEQGKKKSEEDLWENEEFYNAYPEEKLNYTYPKIIQEK